MDCEPGRNNHITIYTHMYALHFKSCVCIPPKIISYTLPGAQMPKLGGH